MDVIVELFVQVLFQVLGEFLVEAGFHGAARVLTSRVGRFLVAAGAGFGAGFWWGARLSTRGRVHEPRALWVSLALAALAGLAALWRWRRGGPVDKQSVGQSVVSPPWRWPAYRLVGLAILNAAVAVGVAIGFHPHSR
ncbi:MAG: hypothetical protein NVSMB32_14330 [Actinomycetota bacterium]